MTIASYSTAQIQVHFRLHCCTSDCYIHNISYSYSWSIYNNLLSDCFHAYISLQKHHSCFNHIWSSQLQFIVMGCIRYMRHWDTELTAANKSLVDKSIVTLTVPHNCNLLKYPWYFCSTVPLHWQFISSTSAYCKVHLLTHLYRATVHGSCAYTILFHDKFCSGRWMGSCNKIKSAVEEDGKLFHNQ